jgi:hypothetical protein
VGVVQVREEVVLTEERRLQARPIHHHKRDSIEAHLTIVFAALAISRFIEEATGWSTKKFVRTARRYRTIEIQPDSPHRHRRTTPTRRPPRSPRRDRAPRQWTLNSGLERTIVRRGRQATGPPFSARNGPPTRADVTNLTRVGLQDHLPRFSPNPSGECRKMSAQTRKARRGAR